MSDEERKAEKKKKKKKHKEHREHKEHKSSKSKKKKHHSDDEEDRKLTPAEASASAAAAADENSSESSTERLERRRSSKLASDENASRRAMLERAKSEHEKSEENAFTADTPVYSTMADDVMQEINASDAVAVDESGGIQAFIAETIEIDGDDVGIIKSDAEVEMEEKKKYSKLFLGAVGAIVVGVIIIAVPLTLKFARGRTRLQYNIITQPPTEVPSMMPSVSPSNMPTSQRFMEITDSLEFISGEELYQQGSPQYMAAMWMADDDPLRMDVDDAGFIQRYIIVLFYYAMDGPNWREKNGWLSELSVCNWFGIDGVSSGCGDALTGGCVPRTDFKGSYDKVCRLGFGKYNNLYGELPSELSYLNEMRYVDIQMDYLFGTIPESLGMNWTKLHTLLLGSNFLKGGFPESFRDNTMLGTIFIQYNKFSGVFPEVFTTLKNLEWLHAENNAFTGSLPDALGNLKSLRILNLNNNSLTGYIPDTWDSDNIIEDLELSDNKLKGPLPASLANAPFLKDLRLSRNELTGSIPTNYYNWEALEELYLDENKIGGELPQTQEPFYNGLQELSLHSNEFEGRFPIEHMEDTFRLKVIQLHRNQLTGTLSTTNICERLDPGRSYTRLMNLTADCDKMTCDCCTACYINGELESGG